MIAHNPPFNRYSTVEGAARLQQELHFLLHEKRPQVTRSVSEAAAQGDRSENAEYIYGKKQLREIDKRIRFLTKRLEELIVVADRPADLKRVFFGAWVKLEDEEGMESELRIVGGDEFDPKRGWVSVNAPLARALLGRTIDDEVVVSLPLGERSYTIVAIRYQGESSQPFTPPEWA